MCRQFEGQLRSQLKQLRWPFLMPNPQTQVPYIPPPHKPSIRRSLEGANAVLSQLRLTGLSDSSAVLEVYGERGNFIVRVQT